MPFFSTALEMLQVTDLRGWHMNAAHSPDDNVSKIREILIVWFALIVLVAITVGVSFVPLGVGNAVLSMAIAIVKVCLVAYFYMHWRSANVYVRTVSLVGLFTISLLFMFSTIDYVNRIAPFAPWQ